MKEQYQYIFSQIHVPSELLLQTKQIVRAEIERLSTHKNITSENGIHSKRKHVKVL